MKKKKKPSGMRITSHCPVSQNRKAQHGGQNRVAKSDPGNLCLCLLTHRRAKTKAAQRTSPRQRLWALDPHSCHHNTEICYPKNPKQELECKPHTEGPYCENWGLILCRLHLVELTLNNQTKFNICKECNSCILEIKLSLLFPQTK